MGIRKTIRSAARKTLGPKLISILRRPFRPKLQHVDEYRDRLRSRRGLEIGGPSAVFAEDGQLPIYDVVKCLDNCLYSSETIWTGEVREGNSFFYSPGKLPGTQIISEAADLHSIKDSSYECVLASHCLEHVANPLRALSEWKRVLKVDGLLLLILPHKDGTFDWRRPSTPLPHMIDDYERGVGENDLTHLPEILELHDLSRDEGAGTREKFRQRCLQNHLHRAMHHHVFDTMNALALVDKAGLQVIRADTLKPYHIIILALRTEGPPDNRTLMGKDAEHWMQSPFQSDRSYGNL
jgi:SAM-dependent methyltransferase